MVEPTPRTPKSSKAEAAGTAPTSVGFVTATIDAATGEIVEVSGAAAFESLDETERATLEDLFEQAFEAGIASVLGEDADELDSDESEEDADLRRQILRPLIERSAARRLMRQDVLGRAIVATLMRNAATQSRSAPPS